MPMYWKLKYVEQPTRERVIDNLLRLRELIAREVPRRSASQTLLLATWNVRDFDSDKFRQGPRLAESFHYIAEVISAFDLVALQEVNEDMRPFEKVMEYLGPRWDYLATDVTEGQSGNGERMVFVFDTAKVQFQRIASDIVLPRTARIDGEHQFARSPYLVRFQAGWFKFNLCTVHLYYGDATGAGYARRVAEIEAITRYLKQRAREDHQNYILLGDMNVVGPDDPTMAALKAQGFLLPSDIGLDNREVQWASNMSGTRHYDQIAFLVRKGELELGDSTSNAGVLNYYKAVFRDDEAETYYPLGRRNGKWPDDAAERQHYFATKWRSWQMSDHLPLFTELRIDFTDDYLQRIRGGTQPVDPPSPDARQG